VKNYLAKQIYSTLFYPLLFVVFIWIIFLIQHFGNYNFTHFGVLPRDAKGLGGIITSVFIHGNLSHIVFNTIPLLVLGMLLFYFYKKIAKAAFLWIWLVSGLWLWIGGRNTITEPTYHIGASTLVYGLAGFLFFSGVFRKHLRLMVVSMLVVFLYGGIVWGIFPIKEEMSWEGHLFGLIAGTLVAFNYRKEGPKRRVYQWEEEDDNEEGNDLNPEEISNQSDEPPQIHINYIITKKDENKN
jgi:membrane associated rhomboid family serine protease